MKPGRKFRPSQSLFTSQRAKSVPRKSRKTTPRAARSVPRPRPLALKADPIQILTRWPAGLPLAALWWLGEGWVMLGVPRATRALAGPRWVSGLEREIARACTPRRRAGSGVAFTGGLVGAISYDAFREAEPAMARRGARARDDRRWPRAVLARVDDALVYDARRRRWWGVGDARGIVRALGEAGPAEKPGRLGALAAAKNRAAFEKGVGRVRGLIAAGDVYQVNLAHRLSARFDGSPRAFFRDLVSSARPAHGGYLEWEDESGPRAIASASPELFLSFDPSEGRLIARPMKGTRPRSPGAARELRKSVKDRAELSMIVDLMRNDLGRICELGSVHVDSPRLIARHGPRAGGVYQAIGQVSGVPRKKLSARGLLAALWPPGSVTGAPKVRAVQIIDGLEKSRRGFYCGSLGFLSRSGCAGASVLIRTAMIARPARRAGRLDYSVGAGVVSRSTPRGEWEETLAKAGVLRSAARPQ